MVNNGFTLNDFTLYLYCLLLVDGIHLPPSPCYYKYLCYKHIRYAGVSPEVERHARRKPTCLPSIVIIPLINKL